MIRGCMERFGIKIASSFLNALLYFFLLRLVFVLGALGVNTPPRTRKAPSTRARLLSYKKCHVLRKRGANRLRASRVNKKISPKGVINPRGLPITTRQVVKMLAFLRLHLWVIFFLQKVACWFIRAFWWIFNFLMHIGRLDVPSTICHCFTLLFFYFLRWSAEPFNRQAKC